MKFFDNDQIENVTYPEPSAPNYLQTVEFVAGANEIGKALGWRQPTAEESRALAAAGDAAWRAGLSNTPSIPGML